MIRVIIIDDHELIRIATASLLSNEKDIEVIGEAATGEEGLELVKKMMPDIVITDIDMPGINGVEVARRIRTNFKKIKTIVLTRHNQSPYPELILEAGANGYVNKGSSSDMLVDAIYKVNRGEKYLAPEVASNLIFKFATLDKQGNPFDKLTKREMQIALMLIQGNRPNDISELLKISVKTIFTHRSRIHSKVGVTNDVELTNIATKYKIM